MGKVRLAQESRIDVHIHTEMFYPLGCLEHDISFGTLGN